MSSRRLEGRTSLVGQLKRLEFDTLSLVGRENELQQLRSAFSSSLSRPLVGISGYSGVGKTALVETFVREMQRREHDSGTFVSETQKRDSRTLFSIGKYDQQSSSVPYSAISFALGKLAIEHEHEVTSSCKEGNMDEEERALVLGVVPDLKQCFAEGNEFLGCNEEDTTSGPFRLERLRSALASFLHVLSKQQRIVICLDDIQWADTASLELVDSLAESKKDCSNLSLFLIWRSNELESASSLKEMLNRHQPLTIDVGNLSVDSLNEMLVHVLQRRLDDTSVMELAEVIHRKSQGNGETVYKRDPAPPCFTILFAYTLPTLLSVFFAKQILTWLQRKMLLFFSLQTYQWEWNLADVAGHTALSDNAIAVVVDKLQDLPPSARRAVMVASCIGSCFDKTLLLNLLTANVLGLSTLTPSLDETPDFELLEESDVICHRQGSQIFRFSHDLVQQAAYSLFRSQDHREKTHFAIGQFLLHSSTIDGPLKQLLATDQLNHGACALRDNVDRFMLMTNNHEAALVAVSKSAFVQAERFHRTAILVFPKEVLWMEYYDLAISMSSIWAETLLTLGEFDEVERIVDEVLLHAKTHSDTCRVLSVMVSCFTSTNRLKEASTFGFRHLRKVRKLKLSQNPGNFHALREFAKAKRSLKKMPIDKLLSTDECNEVAFGYQFLLTRLADNAFLRDNVEASLYLFLKVLNMAFTQGPSKCTAVGFAHYGVFLGAMGDFDGAYEVSKYVSSMADRFKSRAFHFLDYASAYCFSSHLRQPLHELMDPTLNCYRSAMKLSPLVRDVRRHREIILEQNECTSIRCIMDIVGQVALNLTGQPTDPFIIDGEFFQRDNFMDTIVNARLGLGWLTYWSWYLYTSYMLDPSSAHIRLAFSKLYLGKKGLTTLVDGTTAFFVPPFCMMFCLAAIALERDTGKRVFTRKRKFFTKVVQKFVINGVPGVSHRLFLIEAETLTLNAKISTDVVKNTFDKAISSSSRTGFVQDCAIANERCGNFFLQRNDVEWAEYYLTRAMELYGEWGASEKVRMMKTQYSILGRKSQALTASHSSRFRSRERFKEDVGDMHCAEVAQLLFDPHGSGSERL